VGQKVAKGDLLFQVLAKANQPVVPDLYLATLELTMTPTEPSPWLLAAIGC